MKATQSYVLFPTAIGTCALAWSESGISHVQLPERNDDATRARVARHAAPLPAGERAPEWIRRAVRVVQRHLAGDVQDMTTLRVDFAGLPAFHARVYEALRGVPSGKTVSYAELARLAGSPEAVRAVGQAMAKNPLPLVVPCHRVLAAQGRPGGFSAHGGVSTKAQILAIEGVRFGQPEEAPREETEPLFAARVDSELPYDGAEATRQLAASDAKLGALIERVGPFALRLKQTEGAFAALAEAIVYQQLNGRAAATILARVKALFPPRAGAGPRALTPRDIHGASDAALRGAGLSQSKLLALRDLAKKAEDGVVPTLPALAKMSDEEIIEHLTQVRGIGRWTVEMLLIFRLGRPDVFPVTDYGVRQGFQAVYRTRDLPDGPQMMKRGEKWRPYRSVASWYMWRAAELAKAKEKNAT